MTKQAANNLNQVQEYLEGLLPEEILSIQERNRIVSELPEQTPVGPSVAQLVSILILATRPKRVLEIGTATGYSAIAHRQSVETNRRHTDHNRNR